MFIINRVRSHLECSLLSYKIFSHQRTKVNSFILFERGKKIDLPTFFVHAEMKQIKIVKYKDTRYHFSLDNDDAGFCKSKSNLILDIFFKIYPNES